MERDHLRPTMRKLAEQEENLYKYEQTDAESNSEPGSGRMDFLNKR